MTDSIEKVIAKMRNFTGASAGPGAIQGWADRLAAILASAPAAEPCAWTDEREMANMDEVGRCLMWKNKPSRAEPPAVALYTAPQPLPAPEEIERLVDALEEAWLACARGGGDREVLMGCVADARAALLAAYRPAAVSGKPFGYVSDAYWLDGGWSMGMVPKPDAIRKVPVYLAPVQSAGEAFVLAPVIPPESAWGCDSLARSFMRALDMGCKTPREIFRCLRSSGCDVPDWMQNEPEMQCPDHAVSKGTRCVMIYRAMLPAAPTCPPAVCSRCGGKGCNACHDGITP